MSFGTESQSESQYLSSSQSSLPNSKKASQEISKTLQSVIKAPILQQNGHTAGHDDEPVLAPIATATTSQRIKTWSLFAALLNAAIDLGSDEGQREFGQKRYREILKLVQNGDVWEQVVRDGYRGREDSVDAEVVYNLSTLLLGKAQDQTVNQTRLETYLSSSSHSLDFSGVDASLRNGHRTPMNGTSTPKDLSSRVKIIELFTLHVLPANNEWDYARSFVSNSDILDEDAREAFLQTLSELQAVKEQEEVLEDTTDYGTEDEDYSTPQEEESPSKTPQHRGHQRSNSEVDYGIEPHHPNGIKADVEPHKATAAPPMTTIPPKPEPSSSAARPQPTPTRASQLSPPSQTPRRTPGGQSRRSKAQASNSLTAQARQLFTALSNLTRNLSGALIGNSSAVFRLLLFLVAFMMAYSRRDVRERVQAVLGKSWDKMRRTVGMGVKVSYI
ncbi:uncharacterized protein AB675_3585 [Cyphellophora attinorum]|uniref:Peroxin 26 n=1 Tax=Cyphellophora attinorum TaxID=1664694 RepID=A0A0N0NJU3_9EURO|nr:uncharacterized protein AB675_3585 [Phialophora attinorum]KPI37049.1 hypothetical protein AB675_3585 [Phialophora attinorum]